MKMEICGFEHLHLHSDFSLLDGYGQVEEYAKRAATRNNQRFLTISDHGAQGAVPRQIKACEDNHISPIFACELYINPLEQGFKATERKAYIDSLSEEDQKKYRKSCHVLAIAFNEVGYSNLVRLSTWGHLNGFYRKPRVNYEMMMQHKEGIIFTSCCCISEFGWALETEGWDAAEEKIKKYMAMFGENFRLEIMMIDYHKQNEYDRFIIAMHEKYHIPIHITQDTHYCNEEDSHYQQLMLMVQTGRTLNEVEALRADPTQDLFELQDKQLWMKSEDELNDFWQRKYSKVIDYEIFKEAKRETVRICEKAKGVQLDRSIKLPQIPDAEEILKEKIMQGFKWRNLPMTPKYLDRVKEEYRLICKKGFASYFLIQKQMTDEARRICPFILGWGDGSQAVGPGRGSAVGAIVSYCLGITDVDPVHHDLLFSRFISEARGGKSMKIRFTNIDPLPLPEAA